MPAKLKNNKGPKDLAAAVISRLKLNNGSLQYDALLTDLFECMYFASLKTEEARQIALSITFIDPRNPDPDPPPRVRHTLRWTLVPFAQPIELTVPNVAKLAALGSDPRSSS